MEVYVDFMLVKITKANWHLANIESFNELRRHQMKLNFNKCAFELTSKKFLGFMMTQQGIEVNLEKIRAQEKMSNA